LANLIVWAVLMDVSESIEVPVRLPRNVFVPSSRVK
jgi:hypothetical protein